MPIYEYRCEICRETFERLRPMREADEPTTCPRCESKAVERLISEFSAGAGCRTAPGSRFR
jgi:putative FmdB family regulatory protein